MQKEFNLILMNLFQKKKIKKKRKKGKIKKFYNP